MSRLLDFRRPALRTDRTRISAEGQRLTQLVRGGRGNPIRIRRATIIEASSSGTSVAAIARLVAADEHTVRDVIHAFDEEGAARAGPSVGGRPSPPDQ